MKIDVKKTDEVTNRLVGVFGAVIGVFLSRLIVTLTPDKKATLVNWLIGLGSAGLFAILKANDTWYGSLTTAALLGMAGNTVVTGSQSLLQSKNVVAMPTTKEQLTFSKKLQLAAVGYAPNSLTFSNPESATSQVATFTPATKQGLAAAQYDASLWDQYKTVPQRAARMSQNAHLVAGRSTRQTSVAGF